MTQGTQDAADIVLVVDESGSMRTEHEWLLVMIPLLEERLVSAGVCNSITIIAISIPEISPALIKDNHIKENVGFIEWCSTVLLLFS